MSRFINPVPQYWLDDGSIASSGKMVFFENKDYSTKKDTYSQSDNTTENTNPVTLDGQGRMPPCFGDGLYSVKFYAYDNSAIDKLGALQWSRDDVSLSELSGQFNDWSPLFPYRVDDIARGSDGNYYRSLQSGNISNNPIGAAGEFWERIVFITIYNPYRVYQLDEVVMYNGILYRCDESDLTGVTPPSAGWESPEAAIEGQFEPTVEGSIVDGVTTYVDRQGFYTKINNTVFINISLAWSNQTGSGDIIIGNIPFTAISAGSFSVNYDGLTATAGNQICASIDVLSSTFFLSSCDPAGGARANIAIDTSVASLVISGFFRV